MGILMASPLLKSPLTPLFERGEQIAPIAGVK